MLDLTAIDNNVVQATNILASQGGRTMDTVVRDILNGGTNVIYAPRWRTRGDCRDSRATLDATAQLTVDLIDQAVAMLPGPERGPIGDSYVAIVHPYTSYDIARTRTGSRRTSTRPRKRSSTARSARSTTCALW